MVHVAFEPSLLRNLSLLGLPWRDSYVIAEARQFLGPHVVAGRIHQRGVHCCAIRAVDVELGAT